MYIQFDWKYGELQMEMNIKFICDEPRWIRQLFCEFTQAYRRNLEKCALLGFHAVSSGNILQTFRHKLSD